MIHPFFSETSGDTPIFHDYWRYTQLLLEIHPLSDCGRKSINPQVNKSDSLPGPELLAQFHRCGSILTGLSPWGCGPPCGYMNWHLLGSVLTPFWDGWLEEENLSNFLSAQRRKPFSDMSIILVTGPNWAIKKSPWLFRVRIYIYYAVMWG